MAATDRVWTQTRVRPPLSQELAEYARIEYPYESPEYVVETLEKGPGRDRPPTARESFGRLWDWLRRPSSPRANKVKAGSE